jgi:hypothetical protein
MTDNDVRKRNLQSLIRKFNGPTALAKHLGHASPSFLSQLANGFRPITEKTVRKIEKQLGMPQGWFDVDHQNSPTGASPFPPMMDAVLLAVTEELQAQGVSVPPTKMVELVALVYEQSQATGTVDPAQVRRIISLLR